MKEIEVKAHCEDCDSAFTISYVAGAVTGNPIICPFCGEGLDPSYIDGEEMIEDDELQWIPEED